MPALQNITNTSPLRSRLPVDAADCASAPKADAADPRPPELREALRRAARAECQVQELLAALALMESEGCRPRPATVDQGCQPDDGFLALAPALPPPLASPKDTILGLALKLHELRAENHLLRAANADLTARHEEVILQYRALERAAQSTPQPPLRRHSADNMRPLPQSLSLPTVLPFPKTPSQPTSVLQKMRHLVTNAGKTA